MKVPVIIPGTDQSTNGLSVAVYTGRKGPGYALGYNVLHRAVEGLLPNGTYTVEVTSFRPAETGVQTITVKGGPVDGPSIVLAPNGSIPVYVKEDFTSNERGGLSASRGAAALFECGAGTSRRFWNGAQCFAAEPERAWG